MLNMRGKRYHSLRLWHYECRKLFGGVLPILICVLFLALGARDAYQSLVLPRTFEENLTREYMNVLEGEVTEEKRRFIHEQKEEIERILARSAEMTEAYQNGSVDHEAYAAYIAARNDAMDKTEVVEQLEQRLWRIDELAMDGKRAELVFEVGWERIFSSDVDYYLAALLILLLSGIYAYEKRYRFSMILRCSKNGRWKTARTKLFIALLLSFLAGLSSFAYRLMLVTTSIGLSSAHSPAASLVGYENFSGSLLQLLLLNGFLRITGAIVLGLFCFSLSALFEKTLPVMALTALSVLSVPLLHVFDVTVMDALMLNGLLGGMSPILSGAGAIAAVLWSGAAVLLTALSFCKMKGA